MFDPNTPDTPIEKYENISLDELTNKLLSRLEGRVGEIGPEQDSPVFQDSMPTSSTEGEVSPPPTGDTTPLPGEIEETTPEEVADMEPGTGMATGPSDPFSRNSRVGAARAALERQRRASEKRKQEETA